MSWGETMYTIEEIRKMFDLDGRITILENNEDKIIVSSNTEPDEQPFGGLWLRLDENKNCKEFSIKQKDGTYSTPVNISVLPQYIHCSNGLNLEDTLNNIGNKIYSASGESSENIRTIVNDNFKPVVGSKILVRFENDSSVSNLSLKIIKTDGSQIISKKIYFNRRIKDENGLDWINEELTKDYINSNALYEFLYTADGFILMNAICFIAGLNNLGNVKGGGDVSIDKEGKMYIKTHKEEEANSETLGHVKTSNEISDSTDVSLVPTIYCVNLLKNTLLETIQNQSNTLSKNYITNGDFLVNTFHSDELVCDAWIIEEGTFSLDNLTPQGIIINSGKISQCIFDVESISGKDLSLFLSYKGEGKVSIFAGDDILNSVNLELTENQTEIKIDTNGVYLDENSKLYLYLESSSELQIKYVDLKTKPVGNNYIYSHIVESYQDSLKRCELYSNVTGYKNLLRKIDFIDNNLLVNSKFLIDRNETVFPVIENLAPISDGWIFKGNGSVVKEESNSITITGVNTGIYQYLTNGKNFESQQLTFSVRSTGETGKTYIKLICQDSNGEILTNKEETEETIEYTSYAESNSLFTTLNDYIPENTETVKIEVGVVSETQDESTRTINYIKAERGNSFTPLIEKSYAEEYNICDRYEVGSDCLKIAEKTSGIKSNLLINPNCLINQRNFDPELTLRQHTYWYRCSCDTYRFGVDRWMMGISMSQYYTTDTNNKIEGLRVYPRYISTNTVKEDWFRQYIDNVQNLRGKDLTFSCNVKNPSSSVEIKIGFVNNQNVVTYSKSVSLNNGTGIYSVTGACPNNCEYIFVEFYFNSGQGQIILLWAKLEEGNSYTGYEDPNLEQELIKCKSYFQYVEYDNLDLFPLSTKYKRLTIPLNIPMRKKPNCRIISKKYDSLFVGSGQTNVPSNSYKAETDQNNIYFDYRTPNSIATITTSTSKRIDIGVGRGVGATTTYSVNDCRYGSDSNYLQVVGGSTVNNYLYPRELHVGFYLDAEIRLDKSYTECRAKAYDLTSNTSSSEVAVSCTDKYQNSSTYDAYKAFDTSNTTYWRNALTTGAHDLILRFPEPKRIVGLKFYGLNASGSPTINILSSIDNKNFVKESSLSSVSSSEWIDNWDHSVDNVKELRVQVITASDSDYVSIGEVYPVFEEEI